MDKILITKAKVHNLKSVSLSIPRNKLVVITGPSGSGKSSLAFDTIYAEGQRRYIESLSSYARQFIGQMNPPDVESITGLSPSIAIDQKSTSRNPRSTVGTITEIYDFLRVLYARVGQAHCPQSKQPISKQNADQMTSRILKLKQGSKIQILSPVIKTKKGEHKEELGKFLALGFSRMRLNGEHLNLDEKIKIDKNKFNNIDLVIDRFILKTDSRSRISESIEQALKLSSGFVIALEDDKEHFFSEKNYSFITGESYPDLEPRLFSFNSPLGACQICNGLGLKKSFNEQQMILDSSLTLDEGAIPVLKRNSFLLNMVHSVAKTEKIKLNQAYCDLPSSFKKILFKGTEKVYTYKFESENSTFNFKKEFPGIISWLEKKYLESESDRTRSNLEDFMQINICPSCSGKRLNTYALNVKVGEKTIDEISSLPLEKTLSFFHNLKLSSQDTLIAEKLLIEIKERLKFLINVGLSYLSLNRDANTLSGGEAQRIRLATQIGSALSGVLYVLDEPSIGLHQRDNLKLIETLKNLRDLGNTVIVVEHDEETMNAADYLIDMGPKAGAFGGEIVAAGTPKEVTANPRSLTGSFLLGREKISTPKIRRSLKNNIILKGVTENNLKNIDFNLPLGGLICLTGVSGSGKSTLVHQCLVPALKNSLNRNTSLRNVNYHSLSGASHIKSLIELDQSPIGRTPHSNPATYTGLFDGIRTVFSLTNESKVRGYKPGRFSFNVKGGRCEACEGNGVLKIEMHFLPDVFITCHDCNGSRYNKETLNILYRGKNISDVLKMSIAEGVEFFKNHPKISRALKTMDSVGLGYINLGQPATTLSGGEAQRLKLSRELSKSTKGNTLYVLDEPTTGLHFQDIRVLLLAFNQLIEQGHTLLVIEHNLDVIKCADWVIDLGPEGGEKGGQIIAEGTPEEISKSKKSLTGVYLKKHL